MLGEQFALQLRVLAGQAAKTVTHVEALLFAHAIIVSIRIRIIFQALHVQHPTAKSGRITKALAKGRLEYYRFSQCILLLEAAQSRRARQSMQC